MQLATYPHHDKGHTELSEGGQRISDEHAEPDVEMTVYDQKRRPRCAPADTLSTTYRPTVPDIQYLHLYTSWQFIMVFISVSLGFTASFLGMVNSWSGGQVLIPVSLAIDSAEEIIAPLDLLGISSAVNLTIIESSLNMTRIASGLNITRIASSINVEDLIYSGLFEGNLTEIVSDLNVTGSISGLNLTKILSGVDLRVFVSGIHLKQLLHGLNLKVFIPELLYEFPRGVDQVKEGLWTYPTLIFAQAISSVFFGRLSDYVGRRWVFLFGNLVSFVEFLATGRAKEGSSIAGLTGMIGIGTGIQILGPWLALAELVPIRHRFTVTAICVSLFAPLLALHVAIANAFFMFTDETWRWCYYLNAIFSFLSLIGLFFSYHPPTYYQLHNDPTEKPPSKDWLGLLVLIVAVGLITYSLGWGKLILSWSSADVISVLAIGAVALLGFLLYEYKFGTDNSAYPTYLIRNYAHVSHVVLASLGSLILLFAPIAQLLIFLTVTPRFGVQGAWEKLWGTGLVFGFILAAIFLLRPKHLKWHAVISTAFGMLFLAGIQGLHDPDQYRTSMAFLFISGVGHGYATIVTYVAGPMTARKRDIGFVVGLISGFRSLSFAVVRAVIFTLYINIARGNIQRIIPPALAHSGPLSSTLQTTLHGLALTQKTHNIKDLLKLPIAHTLIHALSESFLKTWHRVVPICYIYLLGTFVISVFTSNMDGYLSDHMITRLNRGSLFRLSRRISRE
ncbi:siderophore iron transporter [Paecilomyces variotii No. 5]|uniref:Siderophore iron transporter n=1 Tax=Byssochlamys spectabilis (strain No. 5 / NBRC 109023) TaxID=1356009 RepID=V5FDN5_BYSSN|nr:siderophore iron transporter [Paecilomyces variotii No. 5]